jgi:hypothetical protein
MPLDSSVPGCRLEWRPRKREATGNSQLYDFRVTSSSSFSGPSEPGCRCPVRRGIGHWLVHHRLLPIAQRSGPARRSFDTRSAPPPLTKSGRIPGGSSPAFQRWGRIETQKPETERSKRIPHETFGVKLGFPRGRPSQAEEFAAPNRWRERDEGSGSIRSPRSMCCHRPAPPKRDRFDRARWSACGDPLRPDRGGPRHRGASAHWSCPCRCQRRWSAVP